MLKAYKHRLYPTKAQTELLNKSIGCCRLVYNLALEVKSYAYSSQRINLSCIELINQLPELKDAYPWLKEVDSQSLQQSIRNLDTAYTAFFKGKAEFPKYKSKYRGNNSFRSPHGRLIKFKDGKICIPKFTEGIKIVREREFKGEIRSATVSRNATGKFFISILVETGIPAPAPKPVTESTAIGIDLGLKHFIVDSEGREYDNPRYLRESIERLKVLQARMKSKKRDSKNSKKAYRAIAVIHERIGNQRKDFLHKLSSDMVNNHDTICMEDLQVSNMVKNHKLALSITDAGWGMFGQYITYKCMWQGKNKLQIPTFEASTKVCSHCASRNETLTLADREWICANCGTTHHRDGNAAKVIRKYCLTNHSPAASGGVPVELPALAGTMKQEAVQ